MTGAAATASPHGTAAALEILRAGGNAIDAAAAAAWALCVCEPSGSGLGGQTIVLLRTQNGEVIVVDGHSRAPEAASIGAIEPAEQRIGRKASTIPSTVATLDSMQRTWGRLGRARVFEPALRLAEEGFLVSKLQARESRWVADQLNKSPQTSVLFLNNGRPLRRGDVLRQPALGTTLRRIAKNGADDFYGGEIAQSIACDMALNDGLVSQRDLKTQQKPVVRNPISLEYRGHRIMTAPPPAGGLQLLLALECLERSGDFENRDVRWYVAIAKAVQSAFRCRKEQPQRWAKVEEPGETTHLTVADRQGNVVAVTQSIQSLYGAKVAHPQLGFLYNNYLCTCTRRPGPYQLRGGCLPRSNAAPALVFRPEREGGRLLLALGAAGSRRITSSLLQTISAVVDLRESVQQAVSAPRIHGLLSGPVRLERSCAQPPMVAALQQEFARLIVRPALDFSMGAVQALQFPATGAAMGAADPRRDGVFSILEE